MTASIVLRQSSHSLPIGILIIITIIIIIIIIIKYAAY